MKMSIDGRIKIVELFRKVSENEYCDCRKSKGNAFHFSKSKVIFNRPYFNENGDFIIIGYCICKNCDKKVYIKIPIEKLMKYFGGKENHV